MRAEIQRGSVSVQKEMKQLFLPPVKTLTKNLSFKKKAVITNPDMGSGSEILTQSKNCNLKVADDSNNREIAHWWHIIKESLEAWVWRAGLVLFRRADLCSSLALQGRCLRLSG